MALTADTNYGFLGEVTSAQTPLVLGKGALYSIIGPTDLRVTAGGAGDRAATVALGSAWGDGILSIWETGATVNAGANAGGSRRWDTVVIRRTWTPGSTPTGTATLMVLTGGSSRAVSTARQTDRGTGNSDQPIALLGIDPGSGVVNEVVDIRCWSGAGGGLVAGDAAALGYLTDTGTVVRVGDVVWARVLSGTTPTWSDRIAFKDPVSDGDPVTRGYLLDASAQVLVNRLPTIPRSKLLERGWYERFGPYTIQPNSVINRSFNIPTGRFSSAPSVVLTTSSGWANAAVDSVTAGKVDVQIRNLSPGIELNGLYLYLQAEVRG